MKNLSFILFLSIFILAACNKEEGDVVIENYESSEDLSMVHDIMNDLEDYYSVYIDTQLKSDTEVETRDDCPEITLEHPFGTFPNTYTIDFGEACPGPKGRERSGMIVIEVSAPIYEEGATRVTTLVDFFIDEVQFEATKTLTNIGFDEDENVTLSRILEGGTITFPNGSTATFDANHVVTQTAGGSSPELYDDIAEITGSSNGTNRMGVSFSVEITEPLVKERPCRWFVSGVVELSVEGHDGVRSLDYGDGNCNPFALLTFANGVSIKIILFRKWWK